MAVESAEVLDLTSQGEGCDDQPIPRLVKFLRRSKAKRVTIKLEPGMVPRTVLNLIVGRLGYNIVEERRERGARIVVLERGESGTL